MAISEPGRGLVRRLGVTAAALLVLAAASQQRAEALSLASPGTAAVSEICNRRADDRSSTAAWRRWRWFPAVAAAASGWRRRRFTAADSEAAALRSMAAGFSGGGVAIQRRRLSCGSESTMAAAIATATVTSTTGRTSITGIISIGASMRRAITAIPYYYGYRHRYCRVIWTYYGPRKICQYRPWWRHRYYGYYGSAIGETLKMKQAPGRAPVFSSGWRMWLLNPNP